MSSTTHSSVVCFTRAHSQEPLFKVVFKGVLQSPDFESRGAAKAFLAGLLKGRKPEPVKG